MESEPQRRPLATRQKGWAHALARALSHAGLSPDAISTAGLIFAIAAGFLIWRSGADSGIARVLELLAAAALIQLRLLCNLLDGMVAVEGGRRTAHGELFNDVPDRFADLAIFVGTGYALSSYTWGPALGWLAGVLSVLTAYVRLLGASMTGHHHFEGPMAKQHRMAVMTVACVLSTLEQPFGLHGQIFAIALALIVAGSTVTLARRLALIYGDLERR
jgi:phosphatidylglycerophosphate synthase